MTYIDEDYLASVCNDVMTECTMYGGDPGGPYFEDEKHTWEVLNEILSPLFKNYELRRTKDHFFKLFRKELVDNDNVLANS